MRFRYPLLYPILFGLAFILSVFLVLFYVIDGGSPQLIFGFAAAALFWLWSFYATTQTIFIDSLGIKLESLFGELRSLAWTQIIEMKPTGIFSPGIKIADGMGNSIEINAMFVGYDRIIEAVRTHATSLRRQTAVPAGSLAAGSPNPAGDVLFKARAWRWIGIPVLILFSGLLISTSFRLEAGFYRILSWLAAGFIFFGGFYTYLRQPVLIATRGEKLLIRFQSSHFRHPIHTVASRVRGFGFNHRQGMSVHGPEPSISEVVILLEGKNRITVGNNFGKSPEEIYLALATWLDAYAPPAEDESP